MLLKSHDGAELGVSLISYEFDPAPDEQSANWLEVKLYIRNANGSGWCQAPCMRIFEVAAFASWLRGLGLGQIGTTATHRIMVFQEPNLQLHVEDESAESVSLAVTYNLEQPGEWVLFDPRGYKPTWSGTMGLIVSRDQLRLAAEALERQLRHFPIRSH